MHILFSYEYEAQLNRTLSKSTLIIVIFHQILFSNFKRFSVKKKLEYRHQQIIFDIKLKNNMEKAIKNLRRRGHFTTSTCNLRSNIDDAATLLQLL